MNVTLKAGPVDLCAIIINHNLAQIAIKGNTFFISPVID